MEERSPRKVHIENDTRFTVMMQKQRMALGMSFIRLEEVSGVSKSYLAELEKGRFEPSVQIGLAICGALKIDIEEFISYIYEVKMRKMAQEITDQCNDWGIEVPVFVQRDSFAHMDRLVALAYRSGAEEGQKMMLEAVKKNLNHILGKEDEK